jgi:hypothetical protein
MDSGDWCTKAFFREVFFQAYCSCSVIHKIAAIGYRGSTRATFLVHTPLLTHKDLREYIYNGSKAFPRLTIFRLAFSTIAGIYYMHRFQFLHRDIKPANYLITTSDNSPVVTEHNVSAIMIDLGCTRAIGKDPAASQRVGTAGYQPPEMRSKDGRWPACHLSADVFAWSMIVYALVERKSPWPSQNPLFINQKIMGGVRPIPASRLWDTYTVLKQMMIEGWSHEIEDRPTAQRIFELFVTGEIFPPDLTAGERENLEGFVRSVAEDLRAKEEDARGKLKERNECLDLLMNVLETRSYGAVKALKALARDNGSDAQEVLGTMYHYGIVVERDDRRAFQYLSAAGSAQARGILNEMVASDDPYVRGCIQQAKGNLEAAVNALWEGAKAGSRECVTHLGKILSRTTDRFPQHQAQGMQLLRLARKMGDRKAAFILARRHQYHGQSDLRRQELIAAVELGHPFAPEFLA